MAAEGSENVKRKRLTIESHELLLEAQDSNPVAQVTLIKAGKSLNGIVYPPDVLAAAAHLYNNRPNLLDHKWDPSVRDIAGWFRNARWDSQKQAIVADLHFLQTSAGYVLLSLARQEIKMRAEGLLDEGTHLFGFSHVVIADVEIQQQEEGPDEIIAKEIVDVISVDAVVFPAAGGEVNELQESQQVKQGESCASPEVIKEAIGTAIREALATKQERATRFRDLPLAERRRVWNGSTARRNLRKWASEDGSGDTDTIDWKKYRWGFFWYDQTDPEKLGSYKLPFADIIGGSIKAIPRGIFAAAGVMSGARTGIKIPEEDVPGVKRHIASYYKKMRKEWDEPDLVPPWERKEAHLLDEEVAAIIEEFGVEALQPLIEQGYLPGFGDSNEPAEASGQEPQKEEVEDMAEKKQEEKVTTPVDEQAIREKLAEEFAQKMGGLVEENKTLKQRVQELEEQVKAFEQEKAEAERKAKLEEMFTKHGIDGAARETLEGIVNDMPLDKAEQVISLAASSTPKPDPEPAKKVEEGQTEDDPEEIGKLYAEAVFGVKAEEDEKDA